MRLEMALAVFAAAAIGVAIAQQYFPPGLQYNPFFNPQNPNPYFPAKNISNYNPYFNQFRPQNGSNGFGFFNFWNNFAYRIPFSSFNSSGNGRRARRALGSAFYQPYHCIPDFYQCNGSHSLSIGCLTQWDQVLFRQSYVKPGRWYSRRQKIINYPGDFLPRGYVCNKTITAIRIQDRDCNGTGGYAQVLPGTGVGHCNASVKLFSTGARKGFNFYVQIFGK